MPGRVAAAAIESGLPPASVEQLLAALISGDVLALNTIPGNTPAVSTAAFLALEKAYLGSLHHVWYAACPFAAGGLFGKHNIPRSLTLCRLIADMYQSITVLPQSKI